MKSSILKVALLPMLAGMALFSVGCSDTPSKPPAATEKANAAEPREANSNVAEAREANAGKEVVKEESTQAGARQAPESARKPNSVLPKSVRRVEPPAPVNRTVRRNGQRYFVQTNDGDALNLRASNSRSSAVIGSLPYGTEVIVHLTDRNGEWAEVSAPGYKQGWVAMRFLASDAPEPTYVADVPEPSPNNGRGSSGYFIRMRVSTMDGDNVNVRSGPSLENSVVGSLRDGDTVTRIGEVGQWTEVDTGYGSGYIASDYLVED